jgi:coproporphyrinogen III oxidase-like Fe-S oxidoreductase
MRRVETGKMPVSEAEAISGEEAREEMIMLGLRTARGISERTIRRAAPTRMHELASGGLLTLSRGRASLTPRGMLVSNAVIVDLMGR